MMYSLLIYFQPNLWKSDKIYINVLQNNIQLYARTEIINNTADDSLFWAIDNIRECANQGM